MNEVAHIRVQQLLDHVILESENHYYVYSPSGSVGHFTAYSEALDAFSKITQKGYSYIMLATRIGTGVPVLEQEIK